MQLRRNEKNQINATKRKRIQTKTKEENEEEKGKKEERNGKVKCKNYGNRSEECLQKTYQ